MSSVDRTAEPPAHVQVCGAPTDRVGLPDHAAPGGLTVRLLRRVLDRLTHGRIVLTLPNGAQLDHRAPAPGPEAHLSILRWRAVWRTLARGDIGFAEAFMDGDCASPDIVAVVELFVRNEMALAAIGGFVPVRLLNKLRHLRRANTRSGSRRNILAHYDLGNDFFRHWLDAGMTYSSALYTAPYQSLEDAQSAKQDKILSELALASGMRVLEIGCGWGGLAERIADQGCTVTGLTLSPSQLAYAKARLDAAGQASDLRLQDYRDTGGTFDRIVSIEMLEAVGRAYWPRYFATLKDRLAPDGRAVLQVITLDESRFARYVGRVDFIQHYIFPGGMLPTPSILHAQIAAAGLALRGSVTFGESYARTLAEWSRRFQRALPEVEAQGFDKRFQRLWGYYLAYCEGGFRAGALDVGLYTIAHAPA